MKFYWDKSEEVIDNRLGWNKPLFSINSQGTALINRTLKEKYNLNDSQSVKIKYAKNKDKFIVGFMFSEKKEKDSFPVYCNNKKSLQFSVRILLNEIGIEWGKTMHFFPEFQKIKGKTVLIIEIESIS